MSGILPQSFFDQPPLQLARALLGKVIRHRVQGQWLAARIIETEAYDRREKGSHASLGYTAKRRALFMPPGTLYLYYARGKDSLNISARGEGAGVLIKSGVPWTDELSGADSLALMQQLNPSPQGLPRQPQRLCSGQTLFCRALGIKVVDWDQRCPEPERLRIEAVGYQPGTVIQTTRLGIPQGRDEHLLWRLVDAAEAAHCSRNPLRSRNLPYHLLEADQPLLADGPQDKG